MTSRYMNYVSETAIEVIFTSILRIYIKSLCFYFKDILFFKNIYYLTLSKTLFSSSFFKEFLTIDISDTDIVLKTLKCSSLGHIG